MLANAQTIQLLMAPKICFTASGCLIWHGKVLLVKHKKAKIWLKPGGHVEENELPHQTAEREFFEETGIKVKAARFGIAPELEKNLDSDSEFLPLPFANNLHWVSRENYDLRIGASTKKPHKNLWQRGCEQHCNFDYFVEPVDFGNSDAADSRKQNLNLQLHENPNETDGIGWFSKSELQDLETTEDIRNELQYAFKLLGA